MTHHADKPSWVSQDQKRNRGKALSGPTIQSLRRNESRVKPRGSAKRKGEGESADIEDPPNSFLAINLDQTSLRNLISHLLEIAMIHRLLLAAAAVASSGYASAGVIYDNGVTIRNLIALSDDPVNQRLAEDFVLGPASTVTDIHWTGSYLHSPASTDSFAIRFYDDDAGLPESVPFAEYPVGNQVNRTFEGNNGFFDIYSYRVDIPPLTLTANTRVWLSIVNDTSLVGSVNAWLWAGENDPGFVPSTTPPIIDSYVGLRSLPGPWQENMLGTNRLALDFQLTDDNLAVPEPTSIATWTLLGLGAVGFHRRRRKTAGR